MKKQQSELTEKQLELKDRLEFGDIQKISKALEVSRMHVSRVLNGTKQVKYIWDSIEIFLNSRDEKRAASISQLNS